MADVVAAPQLPVIVYTCDAHEKDIIAGSLNRGECAQCVREERDRLRELVGHISTRLENLTNEWRIARKVPKP